MDNREKHGFTRSHAGCHGLSSTRAGTGADLADSEYGTRGTRRPRNQRSTVSRPALARGSWRRRPWAWAGRPGAWRTGGGCRRGSKQPGGRPGIGPGSRPACARVSDSSVSPVGWVGRSPRPPVGKKGVGASASWGAAGEDAGSSRAAFSPSHHIRPGHNRNDPARPARDRSDQYRRPPPPPPP
jgi:hypothetical protein